MSIFRSESDLSLRKGQINIDYLFGFFIFIILTVSAANIAMGAVGPFYDTVSNNNLHAEAWLFSESFLKSVEIKNHVINETLVYSYGGDRTKLRDSLNDSLGPQYLYRQKILIEQYPVIITETLDGYNHTGSAIFNKSFAPVAVNFTVRNSTFAPVYNIVDVEADDNQYDLNVDDVIQISCVDYTISKIDSEGNFVVLKRTVMDYGWGSIEYDMVAVNRYSTFDGFMARINILYF
ncbi:MAG: hypothetical protein U9P44_01015 [archaeon]|nr:hypothetical protein [archaeon]